MMTVEEILRTKTIDYRTSGRDYLVRCLNPEHEDRHPSMRIDKVTGIFNCLSCGFAGNLFNLFGEKPNWLQIRRNKLKDSIDTKIKETSGLSIPKNAQSFYKSWRNISAETYKRFEAFEHVEFSGRIMFPIRGMSGKIQAFCGRHTGQEHPKYLFYPAHSKIPMFPVVKPIRGSIILVEGLFDMMNLHDKGLTNAICNFGVSKPSKEQMNILRIQGVTCIDLFLDNDEAGQKATEEIQKLLEENEFSTRVIRWGSVKDPGELTAQQVIKIKEKLYEGSSS